MLVAVLMVDRIVLLVLGFLAPRLSTRPQHSVDATLSSGGTDGR